RSIENRRGGRVVDKFAGSELGQRSWPEAQRAKGESQEETSICAGQAATPPEHRKSERWQSGRMRRIRNPVYGFAVPWVRIPPSPPDQALSACRAVDLVPGVFPFGTVRGYFREAYRRVGKGDVARARSPHERSSADEELLEEGRCGRV